jgi:Protein of unknown function (DUF1569)
MKTLANECDLNELQQRFALLGDDEPPLFGTMTPAIAVCHVRESYRWVLGGRAGTLQHKLPLPPGVIKWLALSVPMTWRSGSKTIRELEPGEPGTVPVDFVADKESMLVEMRRFRDSVGASEHAFFGPMTRADWLRWGYLHADHHLRQFGR